MTWSDFYLFCFSVGFLFSVLSFLGGVTHFHLPARFHWHFHFGHHAGGMVGRGKRHGFAGLASFNSMVIMTFLALVGSVFQVPSVGVFLVRLAFDLPLKVCLLHL